MPGVVELAGDLRLFEETPERLGIDGRRFAARNAALAEHDLHRERAAQLFVPHAQDRAHAALGDFAEQAIALVAWSVALQAFEQLPARRGLGVEAWTRRYGLAEALVQLLEHSAVRVHGAAREIVGETAQGGHLAQVALVRGVRRAQRFEVGLLAALDPFTEREVQLLRARVEFGLRGQARGRHARASR